MEVEGRVHELDEVVEGEELGAHAGLITEEIAFLLTVSGRADGLGGGKELTIRFIKPTKPQKATASSCMTA